MTFLMLLAACGTPEVIEPPPAAEPAPAEPAPTEEPAAPAPIRAGTASITPVYHGTVIVETGGKTFWIDPWSRGPIGEHPKADVVLITDNHPDHLDPAAVTAVSKPEVTIVAPKAVADQLDGVDHVLANGEKVTLGDVTVEAVPMYNNVRGPETGGLFHDKGRGNGYVLTIGEERIYFAGDTECTEEMKALTDIDLAFLPMNLPYTMPPSEAAECAKAFRPARLVPYHYAGSDLGELSKALEGSGVEIEQVEFYPGGLPF
jgi:L-ascorbate metabolism protein UlaG (beta-lactamase superfamily)